MPLTISETQFVLGNNVAIGGNVNRTLSNLVNGDVIVVMLAHARSGSGSAVIGTVTSPHLTFAQQVTQAHAANGESRIYTAVYWGLGEVNETITATNLTFAVTDYAICVVRLAGADTSALTTVGVNSSVAAVNPWSVALTATGPNSYVLGCVQAGGTISPGTSTPDANTTEIADLNNDSVNAQVFVRSTNKGGSGSRTVGGTWDSSQTSAFDAAAIEIHELTAPVSVTDPVDGARAAWPVTLTGVASPPGATVEIRNKNTKEVLGSVVSNGTTGAWSFQITSPFFALGTRVTQVKLGEGATSDTTIASGNLTTNPTTGNTLLAWVQFNGGDYAVAMSDTRSLVWTLIGSVFNTTMNVKAYLYSAPVTGSGTESVTATISSAANERQIIVTEVSGIGSLQDYHADWEHDVTDNDSQPLTATATQPAFALDMVSALQGAVGRPTSPATWADEGLYGTFTAVRIASKGISTSGDVNVAMPISFDRNNGILAIFAESTPASAPAVVKAAQNINTGSGVTSVAATISTAAGNLLVALVRNGSNDTDTMSISDSAGQSWTLAGYNSFNTTERCAVWYKANSAAVTSVTVNFSTGGGITRGAIVVHEISGAHPTSPLDSLVATSFDDTATLTSLVSGAITTTQQKTLLLHTIDTGSDQTYTPNAGYSTVANGQNARLSVATKQVSSIQAAVTATYSWTVAANCASFLMAFRGPNTPTDIYRATGFTFPNVKTDISTGGADTTQVLVSDAISTNESITTIVVVVSAGNPIPTDINPPTVVWTNGTTANRPAFTMRTGPVSGSSNYETSIWTARCTAALSNQSITVTLPNAQTDSVIAIAVDALVNAAATMGVSATNPTGGGNWADLRAPIVDLTGVTAGSWLYVVVIGEDDQGAMNGVPTGGITELADIYYNGGQMTAYIGVLPWAAPGNRSIGWTTLNQWGMASALEIKRA